MCIRDSPWWEWWPSALCAAYAPIAVWRKKQAKKRGACWGWISKPCTVPKAVRAACLLYTSIENGGPVEETKIQAEHKTLAWESVSYGDGYLIRTETDSGVTDAQGQPVYQEYRLLVRETGLAQEPFEVYMPLGDLDEEYRTAIDVYKRQE